ALAIAVMTGETFAGRKVFRRAGVLFIAAEGSAEIPVRLQAAYEALGGKGRLPFAWIEQCPRLLDRDAPKALKSIIRDAAKKMREEFNLPLGVIIVDTMAAGAGFGDEGSAAEAQAVMNLLTS